MKSYTNNFITQVEALGNLNSTPLTTMWWTSWLLTLLFVTIETAPVVTKLLSKRGPYDEMLERIEYEHNLMQQQIISEKNNEVNNLLSEIHELNKINGELRVKTMKSKLDAELKANETLLNDISEKQAVLASIAIEKWFREEMENIKNNESNYQKTSSKLSIENKFWKVVNGNPDTFCYFKNDEENNNELIYMENGLVQRGSWQYTIPLKEISTELPTNKQSYVLEGLTEKSVKLVIAYNDYLELTAV
jgi:hypothetical protein